MQEEQIAQTIEAELQRAMGNLQVNNIILSVKLEAAMARIAKLEARPEPLDTMADLDLRHVPEKDGVK